MFCTHCNKECKNVNSLHNHKRLCKSNPNRQISWLEQNLEEMAKRRKESGNINQWSSGNYVIKDETRKKLGEKSKNTVWTEERRQNLSKSMKLAVERNPGAYSSSNRGRTKQISKHGTIFQGQWELDVYEWFVHNSVLIQRNTEGFAYEWNGTRTYFPDFYLPELGVYVEVKGYKTDRDIAKWKHFPKTLYVIDSKVFKLLKNGLFTNATDAVLVAGPGLIIQ